MDRESKSKIDNFVDGLTPPEICYLLGLIKNSIRRYTPKRDGRAGITIESQLLDGKRLSNTNEKGKSINSTFHVCERGIWKQVILFERSGKRKVRE